MSYQPMSKCAVPDCDNPPNYRIEFVCSAHSGRCYVCGVPGGGRECGHTDEFNREATIENTWRTFARNKRMNEDKSPKPVDYEELDKALAVYKAETTLFRQIEAQYLLARDRVRAAKERFETQLREKMP